MKRIFVAMIAMAVMFGMATDVQAQKKTGKKKAKTTQTAKKKPAKPAEPAQKDIELPYNSNDCIFAIPLDLDKAYGPTTAPIGGGRIQEVVADKAHPNLFEHEHNSVWFKIKVPYNGYLEIGIVQKNKWDDYDFLVYKNTGVYFSNQVIQNKVLPVAVNLAAVDSGSMAAAALSGADRKKQPTTQKTAVKTAQGNLPSYQQSVEVKPTIGMRRDADNKMLTKRDVGSFIKSIPVRMGEEYYIVLDGNSRNCEGFTITVSVQADAYEPLVLFYDRKSRRYVDVDLMILERGNGQERPIVQQSNFRGGKVKFVPGFGYTLYAKRDGYFSVFREFNARDLMLQDTVMLYQMERTERGSTFQIKELYYEADEAKLIGNYDSVLMDYVAMFRNHPDITFMLKGYVQSYGVNVEADMLLSLDRAKALKDYFVKHGIAAERITTTGMSKNEIKRAAAAALDRGGGFSPIKAEIIITGKLGDLKTE